MTITTTATIVIRKKPRTLAVEVLPRQPNMAAVLQARGLDGDTYLGTAPKEGRLHAVNMLLVRRVGGDFEPLL